MPAQFAKMPLNSLRMPPLSALNPHRRKILELKIEKIANTTVVKNMLFCFAKISTKVLVKKNNIYT